MQSVAWMTEAKCNGNEDRRFFPEDGEQFPEIVEFCSTCPVRRDCLEYAVSNRLDAGYWGGMSANQRVKLRRRMAKA